MFPLRVHRRLITIHPVPVPFIHQQLIPRSCFPRSSSVSGSYSGLVLVPFPPCSLSAPIPTISFRPRPTQLPSPIPIPSSRSDFHHSVPLSSMFSFLFPLLHPIPICSLWCSVLASSDLHHELTWTQECVVLTAAQCRVVPMVSTGDALHRCLCRSCMYIQNSRSSISHQHIIMNLSSGDAYIMLCSTHLSSV